MMITEIARHEIETAYGKFWLAGFLFGDNQQVVLALWSPPTLTGNAELLLRIQYGCINGTAFKAIDCDCGLQIDSALKRISEHGRGVFVYFADHEAFGFGLVNKMRIVALEKKTRKSFHEVVNAHDYPTAASDVLWTMPHIFREVGADKTIVLLGANFEKSRRLEQLGFSIVRQEDIAVDESQLSQDAIRDRNEKRSIFERMSSSLKKLTNLG